jgi:hypothetical protein
MAETQSSSDNVPRLKKSRAASIWAFFGGITLLVAVGMLVGVGCFYFMVSRAASAPVDKLAQALSTVFGTDVMVSGSTAVLEKSEIGELALVQRKTQAIVKYETTWMGSDKLLIVRGDFLVKAGFDLSEGGNWDILDGKINGKMPEGKVLSVEAIGDFEIYHSDNGTINRLKPQDHANAYNYLKNQARRDAERSDIGKEAERVLLRRINDRMSGLDQDIQWKEETIP